MVETAERTNGTNGSKGARRPVAEMIGRVAFPDRNGALTRRRLAPRAFDDTKPDYEYYDRLRRCKAAGYDIGGLFAQRIERILAAWVIGSGLKVGLYESLAAPLPVTGRDYTNALLAAFVAGLLDAGQAGGDELSDLDTGFTSQLQSLYRDALGLGDQYVIVNVDGTLSVPSPDTVTVARYPLDYRRILSVTIETPLDDYHITDQYRADGRTITVKKGTQILSVDQYENLLGVIPVVHVANERGGNETNGHSVHEPLRELYSQYDDVAFKQLDGVKLLGNPIFAISGLKDLTQARNINAPATPETYLDRGGIERERPQIMIEANASLLIGEGGSAGYVSPPVGFTADTKTALQLLFLLLLDHTGIPESVWGAELGSARASADTQLSQFVKEIVGWQRDAGGWIVKLCRLWLHTKALTDPQILAGRLAIEWDPVQQDDKKIRLKYVEAGRKEGLLTDETALDLLDLVEDPKAEVEAARKEAEARQQAMFPDGADTFGNNLANVASDNLGGNDDDGSN